MSLICVRIHFSAFVRIIEHIEIFLNDYEKVFDVFNSHKGILMDAENFKRTQINEVVISHENKIDNGVMTTYV